MSAQRLRQLAIAVVGIGLALSLASSQFFGSYVQFLVGSLAVTFIVVQAVNLLAGLCGIWSLGHCAFVAIGAYATANLVAIGCPFELILIFAMVTSGLLGLVLGLSVGRFSMLYFALLTMALGMVSTEVISQWTSVTGGDDGKKVAKAFSIVWPGSIDSRNAAAVCTLLATFVYLVGDSLTRGRYGHRWLAIKGQRTASMAIGLRPVHENAYAFGISAALASLSGIGLAISIGFVDPISFKLDSSVTMIVGTVVGGIGASLGALAGSAFLTAVPELARDARALSDFIYGGAIVICLLWLRQGIVPAISSALKNANDRRKIKPVALPHSIDPQAITQLASSLLVPATRPLSLSNVSLKFDGLSVLDRVTFDIRPGETVGLIGPNGAGKTSLLNVVSGFYKPSPDSEIRLGTDDVLAKHASGRAALGIGRTFQHAELFPELTLSQMLMTAAEQGTTLRSSRGVAVVDPGMVVERILDGLNLNQFADALPAELPFGIQKVADIGRTLATGSSVILMDEPYSGLDDQETVELRAVLLGMRQAGVSILIIDHAVQEVLSICDKVVVLNFGKLLAMGPPGEIRSSKPVQEAYFGSTAQAGEPMHA